MEAYIIRLLVWKLRNTHAIRLKSRLSEASIADIYVTKAGNFRNTLFHDFYLKLGIELVQYVRRVMSRRGWARCPSKSKEGRKK
jgi:hypothetical protein